MINQRAAEPGTTKLVSTHANRRLACEFESRLSKSNRRQVAATGVELQDGTIAAVGDRIVTGKNRRQLTNRDGTTFVKNGDIWIVERRHRDGDLTTRDSGGSN